MQTDLWQRRAGWLALVAVIMLSGVVAQARLLVADDSDGPQGAAPRDAEQKWKAALEAANAHAADAQQKAGLGKGRQGEQRGRRAAAQVDEGQRVRAGDADRTAA